MSTCLVFAGIAGALMGVTGCGPDIRSFRVEVRDAITHEPARNVTVFADVPSQDHPFSVASLLGRTGPIDSRAMTNDYGLAELQRIDGRPVRLGVLSAGWAVGEVFINPDAPGFNAQAWIRTDDFSISTSRTPEFLLRP